MGDDNGQKVGALLNTCHNIASKLARVDALLSDLMRSVEALKQGNDSFHERLDNRLREVERKQDQDMGEAHHKQRLKAVIGLLISIIAATSGWMAYLGHWHEK